MAIWVREGSLGTASGSSFANAKSFYDIEDWAPDVAPGTEILFHHLDDFHVPGHGNSPFFRVTLNGAKGAPIILRGALPDGSPARWRARGDRMRFWDRNYRSVQQGKGLFDLDADYVTIQGLHGHHMSWVFRTVGGVGDREGIIIERSHFEQITRILETKNGSDAGGVKYSYFRHITARGHSKSLFKIQQTSHYVWLINIDGDSQFQDGDNFSAGVQFDEDAHHGYVWGSTFRNIKDSLDDYWNGDGVSAESTNSYIEVDGCKFFDITDGGVDSKAPNTVVKNSTDGSLQEEHSILVAFTFDRQHQELRANSPRRCRRELSHLASGRRGSGRGAQFPVRQQGAASAVIVADGDNVAPRAVSKTVE